MTAHAKRSRTAIAAALLALLCLAPAALGAFLPAGGSPEHGWVALPADKDGRIAGLYHFPSIIEPGAARAGPRLVGMPTQLVAGADRLLLVTDEIASPPPPAPTTGNAPERFSAAPAQRRVQAVGVRPGVAPGYFDYRPANRAPETLPSIPNWGRLEAVALAGSTPLALLTPSDASPGPGVRTLLALRGLEWSALPLPADLDPARPARLIADDQRAVLLQTEPGAATRVWSADAEALRARAGSAPPAPQWRLETLPDAPGADLFMLSAGQVIAADVSPADHVRLTALRASGAHRLANVDVPGADRAVFPVGERVYTVWRAADGDPRLYVAVASSLTGEVLYSGPVGSDPIVSGRELHTLALMIGFILLTVMIFALRPDAAQRQATALPEGWSLAGPARRAAAVALDLVPGLLIGAALFRVRPADMLSAALLSPDLLMRDVAAFLTAIAITIAHSAVGECLAGRTLGKCALGLRVVSLDGRRPSPWQALARSALKYLCPPLALFMVLDAMSRHPADVLTGSAVIRKAPAPKQSPPKDDDQPVE